MWHISQVRDCHPKSHVLDLLFKRTILNFYSSLEACEVELLIREFVQTFKTHELIFSSESPEIQVQFSCKDELRKVLGYWGINRYFNLEYSENIVKRVDTCDRVETHEMGDMEEDLGIKVFELSIPLKNLFELQQVCGQEIFTSEDML